MAGLTESDIANILASKRTSAGTRESVLGFLNKASVVSSHRGSAAIDEFRIRNISNVIARRIIARRDSLLGFKDLTQLAGIPGLGKNKFSVLLDFFSRSVTRISAIRFNLGPIQEAALDIRKNFSTSLPDNSWRNGISNTFADSPVLYAIKETLGNAIFIRASFEASGIERAFIRAVGGEPLGQVEETSITFDSDGDSGMQPLRLNATFHSSGVQARNITWRWQWRLHAADPWSELGITRHRLFTILQEPTGPWEQARGSTSLPWTDALEIACNWAAGATDLDEAASLITQRYNACGVVFYDKTGGATSYGKIAYHLTEMIERLNGGEGLGRLVNCTDSANTVSTLSNLLGSDLNQSRMGSIFRMNRVIPIGFNDWTVPFRFGFRDHEVAWKGDCTEDDRVFDGCLQIDADADPTTAPHTPLVPVNMLFGSCSAMKYRQRLCAPTEDGCPHCKPLLREKRRRRII